MTPNSSLSTIPLQQLSIEECNNMIPVKLGNRLYEATKNRDIESVRTIIKSEKFQCVSGFIMGRSLECASINGYVEIARELIQSERYKKIFKDVLSSCLTKSIAGGHLDIANEILQRNQSQNIHLENLNDSLTNIIKENKIEVACAISETKGSTEKFLTNASTSTSLEEPVKEMDPSKLATALENATKINCLELATDILNTDGFASISSSKLFMILETAILNRRSDILELFIDNDRFKQLLIKFSDEILEQSVNASEWKFAKNILRIMKKIGIKQVRSIFSQVVETTSNIDSLEITKLIMNTTEFEKISSRELVHYLNRAVTNHDSNLIEIFLQNDKFKYCESIDLVSCLQVALYHNDFKTINTLLPSIMQLDLTGIKLLLYKAMEINDDVSLQTINSILDSHHCEEISSKWLCSFFEENITHNNWDIIKAILSKKIDNLSTENLEMCLKRATDNEKEDIILMILTSHRYKDIASEYLTMIFERFATLGSSEIVDAILGSTRFNEIPPDLITCWFNQ